VRASLYIGSVWIRQAKELDIKRLLGLLLVMGIVGCGGPVAQLEKLGARIKRNDNGEVVGLRLRGWHVTDAGLMHLMGLTNLQSLCLAGSAKEFAQALESGGLGRRCASACDISRK
jgi:hypothetical protein